MADSLVDPAISSVVLAGMQTSAAAAADSRTRRFDQLAEDAGAMWSVAMTSPTVLAAKGIGVMTESGSGRTRAETNNPPNTAAPGGA